jgi:hypothetical protein
LFEEAGGNSQVLFAEIEERFFDCVSRRFARNQRHGTLAQNDNCRQENGNEANNWIHRTWADGQTHGAKCASRWISAGDLESYEREG